MDETTPEPDVITAYMLDFPGQRKTNIDHIISQLHDNNETITIKPLDNGYTGQIYATPEKHTEIHQHLLGLLPDTVKVSEDVPHPPTISSLSITPSDDFGYYGTLNLSDKGHDLKDYMIAIDGQPHRRGAFIKAGSLGLLGELMAADTIELEISGEPFEVKSDTVPIGCYTDKENNLVGCGVSRVKLFGPIREGEHELTLYVRDNAGNRSFATTKYNI